jgi:very-short-patch-repair endonuclease
MTAIDRSRGWNLRQLNADPERQRQVRAKVRPESNAANGRRGWEATKAKHGASFAAATAASWRRANPNKPTRQVMAWLDEFCVAFELEREIGGCYADVACPDWHLVIEIDGARWHGITPFGEDRRGRDRYKDDTYRVHGWRILRLTEADIKSRAAFDQLDLALHGAQR